MNTFSMIAAIDDDNGIGLGGAMPWHFKGDMMYFKRLTMGVPANPNSAVLMGRKTWDSIPAKFKPLPHRDNLVVSTKATKFKGAAGFNDLPAAVDELVKYSNAFIIGGAQIYNKCINDPRCQYLHLTRIQKIYKCDTFFPPFKDKFELRYKMGTLEEGGVKYGFEEWVRK